MVPGPTPAVRFVRCPKCFCVLPEPTDTIVYECGICHTRLRAKFKERDSDRSILTPSATPDSCASAVDATDPTLPNHQNIGQQLPDISSTSGNLISANGHDESETQNRELPSFLNDVNREEGAGDFRDHVEEWIRGAGEFKGNCIPHEEYLAPSSSGARDGPLRVLSTRAQELKPKSGDSFSEQGNAHYESSANAKKSEGRNVESEETTTDIHDPAREVSASSGDGTPQFIVKSEKFLVDHAGPNSDHSGSPADPIKSPPIRNLPAYYDDGVSSTDDLFPSKQRSSSTKPKLLMRNEYRNTETMQRRRNIEENPSEGHVTNRRSLETYENGSYQRSDVLREQESYLKEIDWKVYMKVREIQELLRTTSLKKEIPRTSEWGSPSTHWRTDYNDQGKSSYIPNKVSHLRFPEDVKSRRQAYYPESDDSGHQRDSELRWAMSMYRGGTKAEEGEGHLPRKHNRERHVMVKQYVRPLSGAAPFVSCSSCLTPLLLPADFLLFDRRCHKLQCGACGEVLKFSLVGANHLAPYTVTRDESAEAPPRRKGKAPREAVVRLHELLGYSSLSQIVGRRRGASSSSGAAAVYDQYGKRK